MHPVVGHDVRVTCDAAAQDVLADKGHEEGVDQIVVERVRARDAGEHHPRDLQDRVVVLGGALAKCLEVIPAQPLDECVDDDVGGAEHVPSSTDFPMFLGKDVRVEARHPLPPLAGDAQVIKAGLDMLTDHLPVEVGIALAQILG